MFAVTLTHRYSADLADALRNRPCKGYHVPDMIVIPPGLDFSQLKVRHMTQAKPRYGSAPVPY